MKPKLFQAIPAAIALLVIIFRYFSLWCTNPGNFCAGTWLDANFLGVIKPLYFFSFYFLAIAIIIIFVQRNVFNSWVNFSIWAVVLAIIFMATQPVYPAMFSTDRDSAARLSGQIFAAVSLILIIWKSIRYHNFRKVKL